MLKVAFFQGADERGQHVFPLFGPSDSVFEKTAAPVLLPEVTRYISTLRPRNDAQYVLLNAMGAVEWWGSNINGDGFREISLIHKPDDWTGNPLLDKVKAENWVYGFPTFYFAHPYAHHRNKDATRAFGEVELAAWNPRMKRVELVTRVDKDKCEKFGGTGVWDKLKAGDFPDVSMGCKVPFDTCSICLDWDTYHKAQATFIPGKHRSEGEAVLIYHRELIKKNGKGIRGVSITRKDYCFPPGTPVLLADGNYKSIEEIVTGDEVISHTGATRRVLHLLPSNTEAGLVVVKPWGMPALQATSNHPFLSARRVGRQESRGMFLDQTAPDWVAAEALREGDILLLPLPEVSAEQVQAPELGWLLGIYLAEGCPNFSPGVAWPKSVSFSFHADERGFAAELLDAARLLDVDVVAHDYAYKNREARTVTINSRKVAEWLYLHGGRGSKNKALLPAVWAYGRPFLAQVLRGWLDGDGSYDWRTGVLRGATSSTTLALQLQRVAGACGVLAALSLQRRTSNFGHQEIWYLGFHGDAARAARSADTQVSFSKQSKLFFWGNYLCSTVCSVQRVDYEGPTYNFEVEEDNSYVAGACAVHNCEHAAKMMNRILPDGRKVFVYNDYPKFFDISFVFIGADKTAKTMMKIAGAGRVFWHVGSAELAEKLGYDESDEVLRPAFGNEQQEKVASIPEEALKTAFLGKLAKNKGAEITKDTIPSQFAGKAVPVLTRVERDMPEDVLEALSASPLEEALSTPAGLGMVLRPREFQRIILVQMGHRPLADRWEREGVVFPRTKDELEVPMGPRFFSQVLARILLPLMGERSALGPSIEKRVLVTRESPKEKHGSTSSLSSDLLRKIGAAYNGYRTGVMELVAHAQDLVSSMASPSSGHLFKLSSAPVNEVFTSLSVNYLKLAYWDEVAGVERGTPSRNTWPTNKIAGGHS